MNERKRAYKPPRLKTQQPAPSPVLLACSDPINSFDCDAAFGLGYQCCQPDEASCANC